MSEQQDRVLRLVGEKPEDGASLLNDVREFVGRFCAFPDEHCLAAVTLWAAHAHMVEHFFTTPRLTLLSPEPGSGKTRVLQVLDLLVPDSMFVFNASPAAIFRTLANTQVTLLFDEIDTIWGKRGGNDNHEDLRALLNAGYKKGMTIPRCTGKSFDVEHFNVYSAVALAGLGEHLPDTILSRSIIIKMRRRAQHERIEPFNSRRHEAEGNALRSRLSGWSLSVGEKTGDAWPTMPKGVEDRNEEIWQPMLAVADEAGGEWPETARKACVALIKAADDRQLSLGIRLLEDLRTLFTRSEQRKLSTAYLIEQLQSAHSGLDDDAPWEDLYGCGINARKLAELLRPYGIKSRKVRINEATLQGYTVEDLYDTWQRYLAPLTPAEAEHAEHAEHAAQTNKCARSSVPNNDNIPEQTEGFTEQFEAELAYLSEDVPDVPYVPDLRG